MGSESGKQPVAFASPSLWFIDVVLIEIDLVRGTRLLIRLIGCSIGLQIADTGATDSALCELIMAAEADSERLIHE